MLGIYPILKIDFLAFYKGPGTLFLRGGGGGSSKKKRPVYPAMYLYSMCAVLDLLLAPLEGF